MGGDTGTPIPEFDISEVAGNASDDLKLKLGNILLAINHASGSKGQQQLNTFGKAIQLRLKPTEFSIISKAEEPTKLEGRAVFEIDVAEDMVNLSGGIHGGCLAFLIDISSGFALIALKLYQTGSSYPDISQALNVVYHSPAAIGDRIRLVNTTLTMGSRVESVRTEVWNVTHHRLVASGVHIKMPPSQPLKAAL